METAHFTETHEEVEGSNLFRSGRMEMQGGKAGIYRQRALVGWSRQERGNLGEKPGVPTDSKGCVGGCRNVWCQRD